ncbi:hypothetical protein CRM22_008649 [Opisthorchis felineus]|uniref:Sm domain-containing protein n=3 Tax=Opisthorchis TaxID=6197 RepID=A0A4S2LI84_OPIFE|nr:hypothetical protein CRM22_008649 [Opisthorchis felineus]TGZ60238.1 hypothetical protein CRM22_008649 [Opisthorchis felineus]TGZ60239.1 hypothetical protein CRM22_008649 [Opisthorchis felineus]
MEEDQLKNDVPMKQGSAGKRTILQYWKSHDPSCVSACQRRIGRGAENRTVGPMARLWRAMKNTEPVLVMTRGLREPRASLTGNLVAFDRYWNLVLSNTTEYSVSLNNSALSGHGRPGRSMRRRRQRRARLFRQMETMSQPVPLFCNNGVDINELSKPNDVEPMEIGSLLSLTDLPDDALVWGWDPSTSHKAPTVQPAPSVPLVVASLQPTSTEPSPVVGNKRDAATQPGGVAGSTKGSKWIPSLAHLTERSISNSNVSVPHKISGIQTPVEASRSNDSKLSVGHQRGQLFIRGANIISVIFLSDSPLFCEKSAD